jgi:hypothetical protein
MRDFLNKLVFKKAAEAPVTAPATATLAKPKVAYKITPMAVTAKKAAPAAKKAAKIKTEEKKTAVLVDAQNEQCFWVNNGPILKNLAELKQAAEEMTGEQFDYHARRDGNDFAKWADEVLGEKALAKKLSQQKTKLGFIKVLADYLK